MATADTRRTLAARRRSDRDRKRRQRDLESQASIPSALDVHKAIAVAIRRQIKARYESAKKLPVESEIRQVLTVAVDVLKARGFDLKAEKAKSRLGAAIGF